MYAHVWGILSTVLPTVSALFAYLKAKETSHKTDTIIVQTNGNLSRITDRNAQLAAELSKNNIPIPPPIVGEK